MRKQRKMGHITVVGPSMRVVEAWVKSMLGEETLDEQPAVAPRVGIIMGSDSDLPVMKDAAKILNDFDVPIEMPRGVPVATVAINNATNAGLLAVRMLGVCDTALQARMAQYQEDTR